MSVKVAHSDNEEERQKEHSDRLSPWAIKLYSWVLALLLLLGIYVTVTSISDWLKTL